MTQSASADLVERASQVFGVAPPRMGEAPGGRAIDWINTPDQEFHVLSSLSGMTVSTRDPGRSDIDDRADAKGPPPSPPRPATQKSFVSTTVAISTPGLRLRRKAARDGPAPAPPAGRPPLCGARPHQGSFHRSSTDVRCRPGWVTADLRSPRAPLHPTQGARVRGAGEACRGCGRSRWRSPAPPLGSHSRRGPPRHR